MVISDLIMIQVPDFIALLSSLIIQSFNYYISLVDPRFNFHVSGIRPNNRQPSSILGSGSRAALLDGSQLSSRHASLVFPQFEVQYLQSHSVRIANPAIRNRMRSFLPKSFRTLTFLILTGHCATLIGCTPYCPAFLLC